MKIAMVKDENGERPVTQNSLEWLMARAGIPTASEWRALVSPTFEIRTGKMPATYLAEKVAEAWLRSPLPGANVLDMEFGKILEEEAVPFYENLFSEPINRVGLVLSDDGRIGCSPDGLIGADGGIEIKCPEADTHVKYLLAGCVPDDYLHQVHGCMLVTGAKWWRFFSYRRKFPPLVTLVERDEKKISVLQEALAAFLERFDAAMNRLAEMNGGFPTPILRG